MLYSWQPRSLKRRFRRRTWKNNGKPLRIRSAFCRLHGTYYRRPYAAWYSSINNRYKTESETRLFRMACSLQRPRKAELPSNAPQSRMV